MSNWPGDSQSMCARGVSADTRMSAAMAQSANEQPRIGIALSHVKAPLAG
jgi:hypothetical protein